MLKPKCIISFNKRNISDADEKKLFKDIVNKTVRCVLSSECSNNIILNCNNEKINGIEVNILFTDDNNIKTINNEYRNIDKSTDVLSFPINDFYYGNGEIDICNTDEDNGRLLLGDIVISVETLHKQAIEYCHSVERECAFLTCHGMLHLLGYDHMNEKDEKQMFGYTNNILESIGYSRNN